MGGHPFPEIPCAVCSEAVNLSAELTANENGKAVHEECYVKHIASSRSSIPATVAAY
jgi:hypothetical protein